MQEISTNQRTDEGDFGGSKRQFGAMEREMWLIFSKVSFQFRESSSTFVCYYQIRFGNVYIYSFNYLLDGIYYTESKWYLEFSSLFRASHIRLFVTKLLPFKTVIVFKYCLILKHLDLNLHIC